jgi:hypothetical protein
MTSGIETACIIQSRRATTAFDWLRAATFVAALLVNGSAVGAKEPETVYLGASHVPISQPGWERYETSVEPGAPQDEPMGGKTARGTLVNTSRPQCFPAENRNVFFGVDGVPTGKDGALEPFDYTDGQGKVNDAGRDAIRGQNTWMLWGEGNDTFWGWLQEEGYGLVDFLVLLNSKDRATRFEKAGMINQPGMKSNSTHKVLGLYLDEADGDQITLQQPKTDIDASSGRLAEHLEAPIDGPACRGCHLTTTADHSNKPKQMRAFEPYDEQKYAEVLAQLPRDGVDPRVYGYPSGVLGLRLFPNPDFFGKSEVATKARANWKDRVEDTNDRFYSDQKIQQDPQLIRPFRVSMSCAFCHLGPHPLNPPEKMDEPRWENLSSTIGNQYWSPPDLFANLTKPDNLLNQFLASQQPGTVDTSLVSTDHINNANTITAIFNIDARLARAGLNPPEVQSPANLLSPVAEEPTQGTNPRHTPRVLLDGADSIGVLGALSRVYLNIGTFSEQWAHLHNPVIGYKPQRPFQLATAQKNSVFWQSAEKYRIPYLAAFFTYKSNQTHESIVAPMKLDKTAIGREVIQRDQALAVQGRSVFVRNCAICHSSKQPESDKPGDDFRLSFSDAWATAAVPREGEPSHFTLPTAFSDWETYKKSAGYLEYVKRITAVAKEPTAAGDEFIKDNFLSTDIRVPITLVGTNSGRAVGTNAMRGQVWADFSSEGYKALPAVGAVHFYNPFSGKPAIDAEGNNDKYFPPAGGPGYYRPASLISLWATAPYLHNNALGLYNQDPTVKGRLEAFDDGINKILWKKYRDPRFDPVPVDKHRPGDLRWSDKELTGADPGFIYRTTVESHIVIPAKFIHELLVGVVGSFWTAFLTLYLWIGLVLVAVILALLARPRHAGFLFLLVAVSSAVLLLILRLDRVYPLLWLVPAVSLGAALFFWLVTQRRVWAQLAFVAVALGALLLGMKVHAFVNAESPANTAPHDLKVGPIPKGTPLNLIMNINPEAPTTNLLWAVAALTRGMLLSSQLTDPAESLRVFQQEAGQALLEVSKCPDFVLDRGHWFAEGLTDEEKNQLKAFLRTL